MKPVHFFCEFCGQEVKASDRICPHCASFFSQVRCQSCGYTGDSKYFLKGCPACGYEGEADSGDKSGKSKKNSSWTEGGFHILPYGVDELTGQVPAKKKSGPPSWVWGILLGVLVTIMMAAWVVVKG